MPERIRVACVQLTAAPDKDAALELAERLVARAAAERRPESYRWPATA
jgi:hypothetical protein